MGAKADDLKRLKSLDAARKRANDAYNDRMKKAGRSVLSVRVLNTTRDTLKKMAEDKDVTVGAVIDEFVSPKTDDQ